MSLESAIDGLTEAVREMVKVLAAARVTVPGGLNGPEAPVKRGAGRPPKSLQELMDATKPTMVGTAVASGVQTISTQPPTLAMPQPDYEQVRLAVITHAENKGHAATMDILKKQFGVDSAKKLKPEQYAAALKACQDGLGVA